MAFLERLRQQKTAREDTARRETERREATCSAQWEEEKQRDALRDIAETFLNESSFRELGTTLANLIGGEVREDPSPYGTRNPDINRLDNVNVGFKILWDKKLLKHDIYRIKYKANAIHIEATPTGIIIVRGGLGGATTLHPEQWRQNPLGNETSLERAYNHPFTHKFDDGYPELLYGSQR